MIHLNFFLLMNHILLCMSVFLKGEGVGEKFSLYSCKNYDSYGTPEQKLIVNLCGIHRFNMEYGKQWLDNKHV